MSILEKDTEVSKLLELLEQSSVIFNNLKNTYGEEYTKTLPLDKHILKYLNNTKKLKNEERNYGIQNSYQGLKWLQNEYIICEDMYNNDNSIGDIAIYLGRTEHAIEGVLLKLGLINSIFKDNKCYYIKNIDNKVCWQLYHLKKLIKIYETSEEILIEKILQQMQPEKNILWKCKGIFENGKARIMTEEDIENKLKELDLM